MKGFECDVCGCKSLQQLQFGVRVSEVVQITVDDGLVCGLQGFEPCQSTTTTFRCGGCLAPVTVAEKDIINFLRYGGK